MPPKFIYFDLGQVLLHFDRERQCQQMAEVAGAAAEKVHAVVFDSGLHWKYEAGELTSQQFYETFCRQTDTRPEYEALLHADSDIFRMNPTIAALVAALQGAGHRLGVLSNTCEAHWNLVSRGQYGILPGAFEQCVLSFEVGAIKPDEKIFRVAAERAGCVPAEIFYADDTPGHVAAARALGFDAVLYTDTATLAEELVRRGLEFNY
jgi:putative hydrolase of the HAD superfamily